MSQSQNTNITPALQLQGRIYCAIVLLGLASTPVLERMPPRAELMLLLILIFLSGIPHGALDTVFAQKIYRVKSTLQWLGFCCSYLVPAGMVIILWQHAPEVFMICFLLISLLHFSADPVHPVPMVSRLLYGGAVIVLPTLLHATEVRTLFGYLVGFEAARNTVTLLQLLAWPWLIASFLAAISIARTSASDSLELTCTCALAVWTAPLVAFTLFFCFMHSARHILRTANYAGASPHRLLGRAALLPTLACAVVFVFGAYSLQTIPVDTRLVQLLFVGLSALTVPHMLLIERARLQGWKPDRSIT